MTPLVYLARPIDLSDDSYPDYIAGQIESIAESFKAALYTPAQAFTLPPGVVPESFVADINRTALNQCHGLIAVLPEWPTIGVGLEIQQAQQLGLPTLIIVTRQTACRSWSLPGLHNEGKVWIHAVPDDETDWSVSTETNLTRAMNDLIQAAWPGPNNAQRRRPAQLDQLRVVLDSANGRMPTRAYKGDAGFDLYCQDDAMVYAGQFVDVACGLSVQLPTGVWGFITGRSSTLRKHNLLVNPGIIDQGYRGPLYVGVKNLGETAFQIKAGMRLAQLIPIGLLAETMLPVQVQQLDESDRGTAGFGSSGE